MICVLLVGDVSETVILGERSSSNVRVDTSGTS
jgi:hypothetical protein